MSDFSNRVLSWFAVHGRKNMPWREDISPWRVWVSEIMLQQTQVETVKPYFTRFMATFPSVADVAQAPLDEVLHLWSGLGYYRRARYLHQASKQVLDKYGGHIPADTKQLMALPGIGRSTAGAISSIAFNTSQAVLDGNIKRVLSRFYMVAGALNQSAVEKKLWAFAQQNLPEHSGADYSLAMMDLGATVCLRINPLCHECPLTSDCQARRNDCVTDYPQPNPSKAKPVRKINMLFIRYRDEILLEQRHQGVWQGLWCPPETERQVEPIQALPHLKPYGLQLLRVGESFTHTFSHYRLQIRPVYVSLKHKPLIIMESNQQVWYKLTVPSKIGIAQPVNKLLKKLSEELNINK